LNVLVERCDLAGKLDLVLCMHEVAFPHQLSINLIHVPSAQEFNLKIGDDYVYTMIENSRKEAFMIYIDQMLKWGCIGFDAAPGNEEQVLANVFEETYAGNQIFDRSHLDELMDSMATQDAMRDKAISADGDFQAPTALAPQPPRKIRVPVVRTQLDFTGKKAVQSSHLAMSLLYHTEHNFIGDTGGVQTQTLMMRIHKRAGNNDIAITLRMKTADLIMALPDLPESLAPRGATASAANGRPFETPALGAGEGSTSKSSELTVWYVDKCAKVPSGAYAELIEVPGMDKPLLLLVSDEDSPRAIRLSITMMVQPFTVIFQVVFLETTEVSAKVEGGRGGNRKVLQQTFNKYFGLNRSTTSSVLAGMTAVAANHRDLDLKKRLDEIAAQEDKPQEHLGIEHGHGIGEPTSKNVEDGAKKSVNVEIVNMCTRQKMGRMMVFTIFRDMIASNMYLRVVMHDPVTNKQQHLTLLHYTTKRLFNLLRINRDMIEQTYVNMTDDDCRDRSKLRQELGKLIVDHLYLRSVGAPGEATEVIDELEFPDGEEVEYELNMRDIMASATSVDLSVNMKNLEDAHAAFPAISNLVQTLGSDAANPPVSMHPAQVSQQSGPLDKHAPVPKTLVEMSEDHLLHKAEKVINGRRVLVAFYNETSSYDNMHYSHNIRIVVACTQSLAILAVQDFHEDALESLCTRRGKRYLMSATSELELVRELFDVLAFEHVGQKIVGITFAGLDD